MQINPATQLLLPLQTLRRKKSMENSRSKNSIKINKTFSHKNLHFKLIISQFFFSDWKFNIDAPSIDN